MPVNLVKIMMKLKKIYSLLSPLYKYSTQNQDLNLFFFMHKTKCTKIAGVCLTKHLGKHQQDNNNQRI